MISRRSEEEGCHLCSPQNVNKPNLLLMFQPNRMQVKKQGSKDPQCSQTGSPEFVFAERVNGKYSVLAGSSRTNLFLTTVPGSVSD